MPTYSPINMPEVEILFHYNPGNAPSWDNPGCPEEVEYIGLTVNGSDVSQELEVSIWVESIIGGIAMAVLFWAVMILSAAVPQ